MLKRLSDTRWSSHANATRAFAKGYKDFCSVFSAVSNDYEEKAVTRQEAVGLLNRFNILETGFLTELWDTILQFRE